MSLARDLASYLTRLTVADFPEATFDYAAMLVASTLASAAAGSGIESSRIVKELAVRQAGQAEACVWFDGRKLPVAQAARVNATMTDAAASDDSDLRNIVHPGTPLVATSLALAEHLDKPGTEVLAAIVTGYEAQARIGSALTPGFRDAGFHGCIIAVFGGAVAAGRLLGLNEHEMTHTIALAATSIGGLMAAANTSWSREYHAGLATFLGIEAALAAQAGFTGEERILEMPRGFIDLHGGGDPALATAGMGHEWLISRELAIKLVPGAHQYHASAEAAANAAIAGNVRPEDVEQIVVSRPGVRSLGGPVRPKDLIDMAHSAAYFVAAAVADRDFSWVHATPEKINDPVIAALCERVVAGPEPPEDQALFKQGATVTIRTKDGNEHSATVFVPEGAAARGVTWGEIEEKAHALLPGAGLNLQHTSEVLAAIKALRSALDLGGLLRSLSRE